MEMEDFMAVDTAETSDMTETPSKLIEHLDYLELESHTPLVALTVMTAGMMIYMRKHRLSVIVLGITLFFLSISIVLSFLHHYYKEEYKELSQAEVAINCIGIATTLVILLNLWFQVGILTPFRKNDMFIFFLFATLFITGMMLQFYIKGYRAWYAAKMGTDEYSEYYDSLYHLNHIQWHAWIAFYGFNYLVMLFMLLKLHESR